VRRFANRLQVEDLGSSNGTFVDGTRIEKATLLGGGAEIRMGATVLVVEGVLPVSSSEADGHDPDPQATRPTQIPSELTRAPTASARPAARMPEALPKTPAQPLREFHPPERQRQRGLASRSWIPVVLSFGTVVLTAVALVIYFAAR
jgi:hypothetical protein